MSDGCRCAELAFSEETRLARWRDVCARFFFAHDAVAQRVLDHFENTSADQIVIETPSTEGAAVHSSEDAAVQELVSSLSLSKCPIPGHQERYNDAVMAMERVKNEVRGEYHRQAARTNYDAFDKHVQRAGQSTNLDPWTSPNGLEHLILRTHEHYERSTVAQSLQHVRVDTFVKQHATNIGCHPFLAGLRLLLEWNLSSPTVVAWRVSDAAFVESGVDFANAAVKLLVQDLNCGHHESPLSPEDGSIRHRVWYLDPYISDYDIRQLAKLFPLPSRLESRGTGTKFETDIHRPNADGTHDEYQPFFQKWCVIL